MEDLFDAVVKARDTQCIQGFQVVETTSKTKQRDRIYKFCVDSIIVIEKRSVKYEIPFALIEWTKIDPIRKNVVLIKIIVRYFLLQAK